MIKNQAFDNPRILVFLVSLFIPYEYKANFSPIYKKAIRGYYLNFDKFTSFDNSAKNYYIPSKKEWGMDPSENNSWTDFKGIEKYIKTSITEKQAPLCWQKYKDSYLAFFIVWWQFCLINKKSYKKRVVQSYLFSLAIGHNNDLKIPTTTIFVS